MRNIRLSIIIVNYNTFKLTRDTIDSCLAEPTYYPYEIFLVDNKSTDDSLVKLEEYFKDEINRGVIHVIANDKNEGFAKANNLAIDKAKGDYVLLLNSDTLLKQGVIDRCMDYMADLKHADVGALGCKITLANGELDKACKRSFPNPRNSFYKLFGVKPKNAEEDNYNLDALDDNGVYEIDCLVGAFMLVRKSTIDDVGSLDGDYFMYGEDVDWCYRIKEAGWKIIYFGEAEIIHYKGGTSKGVSSKDLTKKKKNPKLIYHFYKSMKIFYKKHYTKKYSIFTNIAVYIGIYLLLISKLISNSFKKSN